jgi:FMN phosphatase YigB (HAD superfamily)
VGEELFEPAFAAIRKANDGAVPEDKLEEAFDEMWRHAYDEVAERYEFTKPMFDAGWREFESLEVQRPMTGYGDLQTLAQLPARRFLVTSGFRRLQESKVRALRLETLLDRWEIDAVDGPERLGKQEWFVRIINDAGLDPDEVLVVGDSDRSEIAAGKALGMRTIQTLRPGVPRSSTADMHIASLEELRPLFDEEG